MTTSIVDTVKDRLKIIAKEMGISERQFEITVGLSNGYINKAPKTLSHEMALRIIEKFPKFNRTWLMLGEGNRYAENRYETIGEAVPELLMASEEYAPYKQINTSAVDGQYTETKYAAPSDKTIDSELFELLKTALKESQRANEIILRDNKLVRHDMEELKKRFVSQLSHLESLSRDNMRLKDEVNVLRKQLEEKPTDFGCDRVLKK